MERTVSEFNKKTLVKVSQFKPEELENEDSEVGFQIPFTIKEISSIIVDLNDSTSAVPLKGVLPTKRRKHTLREIQDKKA